MKVRLIFVCLGTGVVLLGQNGTHTAQWHCRISCLPPEPDAPLKLISEENIVSVICGEAPLWLVGESGPEQNSSLARS